VREELPSITRYLICKAGLRRSFGLRLENFQAGRNLEYVNKDRKRTMLFLYTVGRMEPRSAGGLLEDSPNSILHRSKMIASESDWYGLEGWEPRRAVSDSSTSHRFPFASRITKLWLLVRPVPSKYVSMMRGGGRLSVASQVLQVHSCSRRASVSSSSTLN
jgi:hypothetical protein